MKFIKFVLFLLVGMMVLSACVPQVTQTPVDPATQPASDLPAAVTKARQTLARDLGIDPSLVIVVKHTERDWPDSCLGLGGPAESCLAAVTPGYEAVFEANGQTYTYRTDRAGDQIRRADQSPEGTPAGAEGPVLAAQAFVAAQLGISPEDVKRISSEAVEWQDSCLGLGGPAESCLQAVTPGFKLVFEAGGREITVHTDRDGSAIRIAGGLEGVEGSEAREAARRALAGLLGVDPGAVDVIAVEPADWPDACLGLPQPDEMCAQVITPGYRITLGANGEEYVYRTDLTGAGVRPETAPPVEQGDFALEWQLEGETCRVTAVTFDENVAYGPCSSEAVTAPLGSVNPARLEQLADLLALYAPFEAETKAGSVKFHGYGDQQASPAEQRSVAEWVRLVVREIEAGRGSAADGLAFSWSREGGIAGFCDDLAVYLTGYAQASSCKGNPPVDLGQVRLTAAQLERLYGWLDQFRPFEITQTDGAVADSMTIVLNFAGSGRQDAAQGDKEAVLAFAQDIWNGLSASPTGEDLDAAQDVLVSFFDLLDEGKYPEAAALYHGSYAWLIGANSEIRPIDRARLLEAGCTQNGLVCLPVKDVLEAKVLSPNRFQFRVTFANEDGETFVLGPCCGATETEQPPVSEFDYIVRKIAGEYRVTVLPPYVP